MLCKDMNDGFGLSPILLACQFYAHMKNKRISHQTWEDGKWVGTMGKEIYG